MSVRRGESPPGGVPFHYSGTELESLAEAKNYYSWLLGRFEPYLTGTVAEVGAGIGTFTQFLLSVPRIEKVIAIEPGANTYPLLAARYPDYSRVETLRGYLGQYHQSLSVNAVVIVNVLEHVEDDLAFLREAYEATVPGGHLLLFVPALPAIYGSLDRAFEHYRRYTKPTLRDVIGQSGWHIERLAYMNMPGIAAWFFAGRVMKKSRIAASEARAYDRLVLPWLSRLESLIEPPVGSNLLLIGSKSR